MAGVEVEVRSNMLKLLDDLVAINKSAQSLSAQLKNSTEDVGKAVDNQTKKVRTSFQHMQEFGRQVAGQLYKDFKALGSVASVMAGFQISNQFAGSAKEAVMLSDTVRQLGGVFGIASKDFISFQSLMQSGLGAIGASSEAASNALKGLAETPVRGQKNLLAYAKTAAELASISGEKGQEGAIAKGAAAVITARGGNVNDTAQLDSVTKEILQIRHATRGKPVTEITSALTGLYSGTNKDFQKNLKSGGSTQLAAASLFGGPQATAFLEEFMKKSTRERMGLSEQGFNVFGKNGQLDSKAIQGTIEAAKSRGGGDAQSGLSTFGIVGDQAQGFIRLAEALKQNQSAIDGASKSVVDLNSEYRSTMSLGDAFRSNINQVKSLFSAPISWATQHATSALGSTGQNTGQAALVTGAGAIAAAALMGGGLRGLTKGLLGGVLGDEAKSKAIETITGEHVQKVEVINFPGTFGGGNQVASVIPQVAKFAIAGAATLGLGAAAAGAAVFAIQQDRIAKEKNPEKQMAIANSGDRAFGDQAAKGGGALQEWLVSFIKSHQTPTSGSTHEVKVKIEANKKDLKATVAPSRGSPF